MQSLKGRSILVTGGVGSVGRVLVERCLEDDPAVVRVLDLDETGLFNLRAQLEANSHRVNNTFEGLITSSSTNLKVDLE
jgi:FlaA1/EpsC-like NDP-sugar epimerase